MNPARILVGDMRQRLRELPDNSVDAVVTDPPYHLVSIVKRFGSATAAPLNNGDEAADRNGPYRRASRGFMGQTWDGGDVAFRPETWAEVLRVLKPGGHLVAFGGTRTYHRLACAIEDSGFELRDLVAWLYGSGFPKSHDIAKQIDRAAGAEREVIGRRPDHVISKKWREAEGRTDLPESILSITAPATDEAKAWAGWGTALKPALEPIALARKPLSEKSIAANVLRWGTGALNIEASRIDAETVTGWGGKAAGGNTWNGDNCGLAKDGDPRPAQGRWPANVVHDGSAEVLDGFPLTPGQGGNVTGEEPSDCHSGVYSGPRSRFAFPARGDSGSAARFFYCAKASTEDRGDGNDHPTVKPVSLLCWLIRLVTPPGGLVLDPFLGSGSVGIAAEVAQSPFIGVELRAEYAAIAERRMKERAGLFAAVTMEATP
jgi:DNA modification methylase